MRLSLQRKMVRCRELLFAATTDPMHLYLAGTLSFRMGDRTAAARYLLMASEVFPPTDPFQGISLRFARNLLSPPPGTPSQRRHAGTFPSLTH